MSFKNDEVGRRKLVSENFDDLANAQILPLIWLEHSLYCVSRQNFPFVFVSVLLVALAIFEQILHC